MNRGSPAARQMDFFGQWLPLYQLTREGIRHHRAHVSSVFPQVSLWPMILFRASGRRAGRSVGASRLT